MLIPTKMILVVLCVIKALWEHSGFSLLLFSFISISVCKTM